MWISKFDRAKKLKQNLEKELAFYFASEPYRIGTKTDPQSKRLICYITKADDIPEEISLITGDVIQNLRSSLDHLAYKLFTPGPGNGTDGRNVYFPILDNLAQYERDKGRKTEGLEQVAKDLIDTIKPYREGNEILWKIHKLNNIDKHRLLVTVGSSFGSLDLGAHMIASMREAFPEQNIPSVSAFFKPEDNLFPLKVGDELLIDGPNAKPNPEMKFKFEILLNEADIVEGEPLTEALQSMIDEVELLFPKFQPLIT